MNNSYPHPILAKEGWPFLILLLVGAVGVQFLLGFWVALPWWLGLLFVIQFSGTRPARLPARDPGASSLLPMAASSPWRRRRMSI